MSYRETGRAERIWATTYCKLWDTGSERYVLLKPKPPQGAARPTVAPVLFVVRSR